MRILQTDEERKKLHDAAEARAKTYGITFKPGKGHLTPPEGYPTSETEYGDPVNYAYPISKDFIHAAVSYAAHRGAREHGDYSIGEWTKVLQRIAEAANRLIGPGHKVEDRWGGGPEIIHEEPEEAKATADAVEILDAPTAEEPQRPVRFRLPVMQAGTVNDNNRLYPRDLVAKAVTDANRRAEAGEMLAESPHPEPFRDLNGNVRFRTDYRNVAAKIFHVAMDAASGRVFADYEVISGGPGDVIGNLARARAKIGSSVRAVAVADAREMNGKRVDVAKSLDIHSFDLVPNPATASAMGMPQPLTDAQIAALPAPPPDPSFFPEAAPEPTGTEGVGSQVNLDELLKDPAFKAQYDAQIATAAAAAAQPIQDELQRIRGEQEAATRKAEAVAFVDAEIAKLDRFDAGTKSTIAEAAKTAKTVDEAKAILDSQVSVADKLVAALRANGLGYTPGQGGGVAQTRVAVNEPSPFLDEVRKIGDALDQYAVSHGYAIDKKLREINRPKLQRILDKFDERNNSAISDEIQRMRGVTDGVRAFTDDVTTQTVMNQPSVVRTIVEQAFQELQGLQFVEDGTFDGQTAEIPVETYTRESTASSNLQVSEGAVVGRGRVNITWVPVAGAWRKLAAVITREAEKQMGSGPLHYQAVARAIYHVGYDMRRQLDTDIHNEHLQAADEYGAVAVANETIAYNSSTQVLVDAATGQTYLLPAKGGSGAAPNTNIPMVRPRVVKYLTSNGWVTTTTNPVTVSNGSQLTVGTFDASGMVTGGACAIDYENGRIYLATGSVLTTGNYTLSYSYVTNIALFSTTTPDTGAYSTQPQEWYLNQLLETIGAQKAKMGSAPVFYTPNFGIVSVSAGELISNALLFSRQYEKPGNELDQDGFVGMVKGIPIVGINAPWNGGDTRIVLGQRGAQKFYVGQPMQIDGPYEVRDQATAQLTDEKEFLATTLVAQKTPVLARLRTIKLTA